MRRLLAAVIAAALALALTAAPAMANDSDNLDNIDNFGVLSDLGLLGDDGLGLFAEEELDTIDVGDVECLVEDGDDVEFCVNEETGDTFNV